MHLYVLKLTCVYKIIYCNIIYESIKNWSKLDFPQLGTEINSGNIQYTQINKWNIM